MTDDTSPSTDISPLVTKTDDGQIEIRDTPGGPALTVSPASFEALLAAVSKGDNPTSSQSN